jgi:uncharacterized protein (DUF433 family)
MARATKQKQDLWRQRLLVPFYRIGEAAKYAGTSAVTAARWHGETSVLPERDARAELSYLQLIELGVVAAMRSAGVKLLKIKGARDYISDKWGVDFPFARYRFKTDGVHVIMDYEDIAPDAGVADRLLYASDSGQLGWKEILDRRLREFEYENGGVVVRWRVGGAQSPVVIDPRLSFGAPVVAGTATWAIKSRWDSGESVGDIADDFELSSDFVAAALKFEGISPDYSRPNLWVS